MAEVKAQLNSLRLAPRKVRAIANLVKGKPVTEAIDQLEYLMRRHAVPLLKLLNSAIANAENNFDMVKSNLFIKNMIVNEGVKLKRFKPKGFGMVSPIQKKTSKITIILGEKVAGLKAEKSESKKETTTKETEKIEPVIQENRQKVIKPEIKKEVGTKKESPLGGVRKLFRRKAI